MSDIPENVIEDAGYTLGELHRLILDYSSNATLRVQLKILSKDGTPIALGLVTSPL